MQKATPLRPTISAYTSIAPADIEDYDFLRTRPVALASCTILRAFLFQLHSSKEAREMPSSHRHTPTAEAPSVTSYGQVIEYIQGTTTPTNNTTMADPSPPAIIANMHILEYTDRLYLASYTHAPDANTPFPYPSKPTRSPKKRSSRAPSGPQRVPEESKPAPVYFSIDRSLLYNAFHADFGPLHIGHLYRFAVQLHDVLGQQEGENRPVVFWSTADSRSMFMTVECI